MGERPVQLVRLEQRKVDPCAPIHSIKGQVQRKEEITVLLSRGSFHSSTRFDSV
jgi:hypothetical protein